MLDFVLHLDKHLQGVIDKRGAGSTYGVLWAIVFAETGFVLTPFLPGEAHRLFGPALHICNGSLQAACRRLPALCSRGLLCLWRPAPGNCVRCLSVSCDPWRRCELLHWQPCG